MRELALHLLDLVENSARAGASEIRIDIIEDPAVDRMELVVTDNGPGMTTTLMAATDPFTTGKTGCETGLGLPLLKAAAEQAGGNLAINSVEGQGTRVATWFRYGHLDRLPLGDLAATVAGMIATHPGVNFVYHHRYRERVLYFCTRKIQAVIGPLPAYLTPVATWLGQRLNRDLAALYSGEGGELIEIP